MTQAYPLSWPDGWPRTKPNYRMRISQRFWNLSLHKAVTGLYQELSRLGARSIVVSTNVEPRLDGMPRAGQRAPDDPGAAVYFHYLDRPMVMAQDKWVEIEGNIRSLALAIQYLRGLERHGGGHMMERAFHGFSALPPPKQSTAPSARPWREVLGMDAPYLADMPVADVIVIAESRYRSAARDAHPDRGHDAADMIELNAAIAEARRELAGD